MITRSAGKWNFGSIELNLKIAVIYGNKFSRLDSTKVGAGNGLGMSSDGGAPRSAPSQVTMRQTSTRIIFGDATDLDVAKPLGRLEKA